jgi:hypothetical protein
MSGLIARRNNLLFMKNNTLIAVLIIVLFIIVGFMVLGSSASDKKSADSFGETTGTVAKIYKSPSCGCCGVYATYMKREGYEVEIEDVEDLSAIKQRLGVPYELESCHTTEVGGYVVEGHIPEEAIQKLLSEKPDIKGIGMAGMPSGSPGMPGPKTSDFVIYEINNDGTRGDIFVIL